MKIRTDIKKFNAPNMTLVGILLGISFWIIDPLIDARLLSGGTFWNNAFNPDSKEIWLRSFISFLFLSFGIFAEFISSKRKRIEKVLRDSEGKFRLLYEDAPLGYQSLNENGNILKINRAWLNLLGYAEDEVTGRWFGDFLDEDSRAKFRNRFPIFKARGEVHGADFVMMKKDGSPLSVSFDSRISYNEKGEFKQTHCIMRDETERLRAEEILRRNEARFRELAELLPETVIETDREGNLTFINCHALNKFKYSAEDFQKGLNIFQFIVPEDKERAIQNFQKLLNGDRGHNNEYTALRKDGSPIQVDIYSAPIIQDGKPMGIRGIVVDVTERKDAEIALRLSEERFRTIADHTYGWEDWISPSGSLLWTNPSVERITGYSAKECLSMPDYPLPLIIEEDREQAMATFAQSVDGNWVDDFTFRIRRKDGQIIWMAVATKPVFDSEGRHLGTRASLRDISRQREAEEALRKSEENYRTLMEQASDGIFVTDMSGNYIDINNSGCAMLGYSREEVLGTNIANLVCAEGLERLLPSGFHELETNKPVISEVWLKRKDGSQLEVEISAKKLTDERFQGIFRDITERKKVERALHESERRFRLAIENYPGAVFIYDSDRRIEFANPLALTLSGLTLERMLGHTDDEIFPQELTSEFLPMLTRVFETGQTQSGEFEFKPPFSPMHISINYVPLLNEQGQVYQVFAFGQDITERKKAEKELRESKERYQDLYNNAHVGLFRTRLSDGMVFECNDHIARMLGFENRFQLINIRAAEFWVEPGARQAFIDELNSKGEVNNLECKLGRSGELPIWVSITARVCREEGYIEGVIVDITERKRAEEQIVKLSQAVEQSPVSVVLTDLQGNIEYINPKFTDLTGYAFEEALGQNPRILKSGQTADEEYKKLWAKITGGGQWLGEFRNKKKNGELFWEKASISPIRNRKGEITHYLGIKEDITERKKMEEALHRNERFLQAVFDSIQDGICVVDRDMNIIRTNEASEREFKAMLPLAGKKCFHVYGKGNGICNGCPSIRAMESKMPQMAEVPVAGADTRSEWLEVHSFPMLDEHNNCTGAIKYIRNVSERKRAEEALLENEAKYRTLFEYSVDGIFLMTDLFFDCNEQACKMWACEREDIVGHSPVEFSPEFQPDGRTSAESAKEKIDAALSGTPQRFYWKHLRKDGTLIDTEVALKAIIVNDRKILQATVRDMTEQKKAGELLNAERRLFIGGPTVVFKWREAEGWPVEYVSPNVTNQFGYNPEDLTSGRILYASIVHPDDRGRIAAEANACGDAKIPCFEQEYRVAHANGEYRWVYDFTVIVRNSVGVITHYHGYVMDITERKEAEERVKQSRSLLAAALESTADGILVVNAKGEIESFNRRFLQLWSIPEDIIALRDDNKALEYVLNQLKYPQQFLDGVKSLYATPEAESFDILEFKDGKYFERFSLPQKIGKDIVGRVWSFRDVTDRNRAQEAFSEEKERLAVTLRSIGDGVITTDTDGFVTLINSVAERLTGWSPDEAIGKKLEQVFKIISNVTRETMPSPVDRALLFGGPIELDSNTVLLTRDGSERMIADSAAPIKDEKGDAIGVVLVFRDITEKLKIEDELAKTEKLESLGILAGGIAHDFNNILTAIMGNISLAKMNLSENTEVSEILISAEDAAARAQDLTHQLLTFARGGVPIKKTASIIPIIKEAACFALHGSNVRCDFSFDDNLFPVEFDETQMSRVISNLVINSHQAMPEGGVINISAANINASLVDHPILREGNWVKITVKDPGIGIPPQYIDKIFDPFFTTKQKGSGLGLAISYSIVKKHGGHIEVDSNEGTGSSLHIYLPASRQKIEESRNEDEKPAPGVGKILVMDDDEGVRSVADITLSRLGYQVTTARDGREAIESYKNAKESGQPFEAIIMDLTIPGGLGGKESIAILRQYDPSVKAIVSSGYNNDPIMADYRKFGFCGAVCKPYNALQLGSILQEILGKAELPVSPS